LIEAGIVGATGLVGATMIQVLQERSFPADRIRAFASGRHGDRTVTVGDITYPVEIINPASIGQGAILLGATSSEVARTWIPGCVEAGAVVVDNSSAYRMEEGVPLVVPEVNPGEALEHRGIVANPNCSTIQLVVALAPLYAISPFEWVAVSTYQAVSGAGGASLGRLEQEWRDGPPFDGAEYSGRVLTEIGKPAGDRYCREESKLMQETCKIMGVDFPVFPSCARVPVRTGHTESVTVRFSGTVTAAEAAAALEGAPGVRLFESGVTPMTVEGEDFVAVSRIRNHPADRRVLQFWVAADNLRKGAALNAVQIAELLVRE
jgi:aspartate-semialdehyde dehydrogenase